MQDLKSGQYTTKYWLNANDDDMLKMNVRMNDNMVNE